MNNDPSHHNDDRSSPNTRQLDRKVLEARVAASVSEVFTLPGLEAAIYRDEHVRTIMIPASDKGLGLMGYSRVELSERDATDDVPVSQLGISVYSGESRDADRVWGATQYLNGEVEWVREAAEHGISGTTIVREARLLFETTDEQFEYIVAARGATEEGGAATDDDLRLMNRIMILANQDAKWLSEALRSPDA